MSYNLQGKNFNSWLLFSNKAPTPPPEIDEDTTLTGEDRGVPTIRQPSPAALAVIQEYLDRKRMRLLDLFSQADKDKNWVVSRQEFRNIIRSWKIPLTEVDLEDLIMALDRDNSDALDYRELAVGRQSYLEERWGWCCLDQMEIGWDCGTSR